MEVGGLNMPDTRDVEAISKASNYVRHGTTFLGGSFAACPCPKQACGGVAEDDQDRYCPEHSKDPAQVWHWAAECPGAASI
ncbi:hypothetical protein ACH4GZ_38910 [Streptomyces hygroscopicus]|uniref:hypothetical protein n=1 Tax=Streptomyces hygroscopicus TaxID=1912 RepID=UPI0037AC4D6C